MASKFVDFWMELAFKVKFKSVSPSHQESANDPHPSLNFIHTERPQWATKPVSPKPTTDFSKPYFSIKTTTYRPILMNEQPDTRPNFVSKPNGPSTAVKTSTTIRPSHSSGQSTTRYPTMSLRSYPRKFFLSLSFPLLFNCAELTRNRKFPP